MLREKVKPELSLEGTWAPEGTGVTFQGRDWQEEQDHVGKLGWSA